MDALLRLQRRQSGVMSRGQALSLGVDAVFVERMLRRREWVRVHDGVYVDHTGPLSQRQREWAALLRYPGSVLSAQAALSAAGLEGDGRPRRVDLAVQHGRRVARTPGITVTQLRCFESAALLEASPPRLRVEHAALLVASTAAGEDAAVAAIADVVREGATTTDRLLDALSHHPKLPRRALLREVLADVAEGAQSPLERRYLRDVERAHGLPRGERQVREVVRVVEGELLRWVVRDVRYRAQQALLELDGRIGHSAALDRWADLQRDLDAAVHGDLTLRAGWQQVLDRCRLASVVGRVLQARGWAGTPVPCRSDSCVVRSEAAA
ncbi:unannotated protein [freshwater metagenome]|uniref:Unannotated protein n=1 Tax=freshwater metagenome TaxID=449393 RepID=A0A6J6UBU0_9ZZZZ|nr:hypothetical protein [Actinomycetota bacterium]